MLSLVFLVVFLFIHLAVAA